MHDLEEEKYASSEYMSNDDFFSSSENLQKLTGNSTATAKSRDTTALS
jgi:hypothetical protein